MVDTEESPSALPSRSRRARWAFYVLLLLAFGVRLHGLGFHSLWLDEAISIHLASFPWSEIFQQGMSLQEPNPPLYHLALSLWMRAFGSGVAVVRLLSAFLGTLYLPALYLLGKRLFSTRLALMATLLAALNPFLVWYSQEVRMYAMVAALSVWSLYCFARALETDRRSWWVAYVFLTVASLYTHLYAVFLLPAEILFLLLYPRRHRKAWLQGAASWGLSLLCFSPWLLRAWQLSGTVPSWRPSLTLGAMLSACLEAFTVRRVPLPPLELGVIMAVCAVFVLAGLLMHRVPQRGSVPRGWRPLDMRSSVFLILSLVFPLMLAYLLSFRQEIFTVYYLIVIVAPFLLALAAGLDKTAAFSKLAGLVSLLTVVGIFSYGLRHNWSLDYRKEEWRAAAQYVARHAREGDAILCHVDYTRIPFSYYYEGAVPIFAPFGGPPTSYPDVARTLEGLSGYGTIWLVQSHTDWVDPTRTVEAWLSSSFPVVTEQFPPGVEVKGYSASYRLEQVPSTARRVDAVYDEKVRLAAYELDGEAFSATDDTYHPPSGWIHVTLYWQPLLPLTEEYVATVELVDDAHRVWGGQLNRPTGTMRFYPPTVWRFGEVIRDDYDVNLNPMTPEGVYDLQVSLFTTLGEQAPASYEGGEWVAVPLVRVRILPP